MLTTSTTPLILHQEDNRNFGLDLIRGGGITVFIGYHGLQLFAPYFPKIWMFGTPAVLLIEFFFVLSGFLIGTILLRRYFSGEAFDGRAVMHFFVRRWLRTFPLYFLVLALLFFFRWLGHQPGESGPVWTYLVFLQCWSGTATSFFPESWSLCIEEWFYFGLPVFLWLLTQLFTHWLSPQRIVGLLLFAVLIGVLIYRTSQVLDHSIRFDEGLRKITSYRLDAPLYGVVVAFYWIRFREQLVRYKNALLLLGASCVLASFVLIKVDSLVLLRNVLYWPLITVGFSLSLPFFIQLRDPGGRFSRYIRYTSRITYSLYLLHLSVSLFGLTLPLVPVHSLSTAFLASLGYLLFTISLAVLSYRFIERPIFKLRNRYFPEP